MHELYELKDKLCEELKEYGNKEMSKTNLEVIEKLSSAVKNLGKIIEKYDEEEEYSSMNGGSYRGSYEGRSNRGGRGSYEGRSYRGSYARRRDAMGRYSRDAEMVAELRELMEDAPDDKTRQEFQRFISRLEQI